MRIRDKYFGERSVRFFDNGPRSITHEGHKLLEIYEIYQEGIGLINTNILKDHISSSSRGRWVVNDLFQNTNKPEARAVFVE